jgi:hypothetical protein
VFHIPLYGAVLARKSIDGAAAEAAVCLTHLDVAVPLQNFFNTALNGKAMIVGQQLQKTTLDALLIQLTIHSEGTISWMKTLQACVSLNCRFDFQHLRVYTDEPQ